MTNLLLRIAGILLIVPAILISPLVPKPGQERPWSMGLFRNIWHAYGKYDARSWLRRLVSAMKDPAIVLQYWDILTSKYDVEYVGSYLMDPRRLRPMHNVQTDHPHHRQRVREYAAGLTPISSYGDIIVVDGYIHDGHHRVAALNEAGARQVLVDYYTKKIKPEKSNPKNVPQTETAKRIS